MSDEIVDVTPVITWSPLELRPEDCLAPATSDGLLTWLRGGPQLAALLAQHKAVVFRGFGVAPTEIDTVFDLMLDRRLAYVHGNSPRTKVGNNIYTSTEYPAEFTISMHNELSYAAHWPARLAFFCEQAPETGGETTVVDGQLWLGGLDAEIRTAFAGGVRYTQNLHGGRGLGRSWQATFETDDRQVIEEYLAGAGAEWQWFPNNTLRISQIRPSTTVHPVTGAEVWFNQADQWHPSGLGDDIAAELASMMPTDELPQFVTYADGSPIPDGYLQQIREVGLAAAVGVKWHPGDVLLIDNLLVGHGRSTFSGARRILVAMSG